MSEWLVPICFLVAGGIAVWLMYGWALREYLQKGDHDAASVTIIAMFGTFLPFICFAAIAYVLIHERAFQEQWAAEDAKLEAQWRVELETATRDAAIKHDLGKDKLP